ncbi:MAG: type II secretion system protein GspM [Massilia sp.]
MKQRLQTLRLRIDALTLRERAMVFLGAAALIVFLGSYFVFNPMFARQAALRAQVSQQQNLIAGIDAEITQKVLAHAADPDAPLLARIAAVKAESATLASNLRGMHASLVAPEQMAPLLESLLKTNGKLRLESLSTLPEEPTKAGAPAPLFYRHGVQLTVSGSYADMVAYMDAVHAMPTQLFWGGARLDAQAYPVARLTLTLYTLSLDATWMSL